MNGQDFSARNSVFFIRPKAEMAAHNFILKEILSDDEKKLWHGKKPLCAVVEMKIKKNTHMSSLKKNPCY